MVCEVVEEEGGKIKEWIEEDNDGGDKSKIGNSGVSFYQRQE